MNSTSFLKEIIIYPQTSGYIVGVQHKWEVDPDGDAAYNAHHDSDTDKKYVTKIEKYACNDATEALDIVSQYMRSDGPAQDIYFDDAVEDSVRAPVVKRRKRRKKAE